MRGCDLRETWFVLKRDSKYDAVFDDDDGLLRETLVCINKTAMRHKRGECNRSDRNFKATQTVIIFERWLAHKPHSSRKNCSNSADGGMSSAGVSQGFHAGSCDCSSKYVGVCSNI